MAGQNLSDETKLAPVRDRLVQDLKRNHDWLYDLEEFPEPPKPENRQKIREAFSTLTDSQKDEWVRMFLANDGELPSVSRAKRGCEAKGYRIIQERDPLFSTIDMNLNDLLADRGDGRLRTVADRAAVESYETRRKQLATPSDDASGPDQSSSTASTTNTVTGAGFDNTSVANESVSLQRLPTESIFIRPEDGEREARVTIHRCEPHTEAGHYRMRLYDPENPTGLPNGRTTDGGKLVASLTSGLRESEYEVFYKKELVAQLAATDRETVREWAKLYIAERFRNDYDAVNPRSRQSQESLRREHEKVRAEWR